MLNTTSDIKISAKKYPFISIIIPVRNESVYIENTINSILLNDYPKEKMEIIVVDGMSDDGTREIIENLAQKEPRVRMLDNPKRIIPCALNIGIKDCKSDIYIRIDGHAHIPPNFIVNSVTCLKEHPEAWVAGGSIKTIGLNYISKAIAAAMSSRVGAGNAMFRLGDYEGYVDTIAFGAHHMWIFDKIGYFDETMLINEDDDFNLRINMAGGKIWMSKEVFSTYYARGSLFKLSKQYWRYGFWRIRTIQKHKQAASLRQIIPLLLVLSLISLGLTASIFPFIGFLLMIELVLYAAVLVLGIFEIGIKFKWKHAFISPVIFLILHFTYGAGSLWGFIRFVLLRGWGIEKFKDMNISR